jgi:signal transduction histidine kinase/ActR/RegA family two-component response regulator
MICCLAASESDAWYALMLREQYSFYARFLLQYFLLASKEGALAPHALGNLVVIAAIWSLYKGLEWVQRQQIRRRIAFLYYQLMQLAQVYLAFQYPEISFSFVIASTIVLVHIEVAMCLGPVESSLLIGKFFVMWSYYAWNLGKVAGYVSEAAMSEAALSMFWALFHLVNCSEARRSIAGKRTESMREVQEEKERMQALLQSIPDGVAVITEDRKVVTYNHMLLRMLQLQTSEHLGQLLHNALGMLTYAPLYKKTTSACQHLLEDVIEHIARERENTSIDFGSVVHMGHYLEWRGTTSRWNQSKACILVVRDVGEWVELEVLAKKENEAKSALIRSVSHELRTPINAILNISYRLLEDPSLSEKQKEQCQILVSSSNFLLSNVNDLLDFSRITNQQFSLNKQLFKLEEAIHSCVKLIEPQCRLKHLRLCFRYDTTIPTMIYNDSNRLKQVLLNLLSNALKFTLKGKIEVVALLTQSNLLKITVEDTGIGIAEAHQSRIFTLFGKLAGNEKLNPQGCGLGLAISNTLVTLMGGVGISISSLPGQGSTFSFELPVDGRKVSISEESEDITCVDKGEADELGSLSVRLPTSYELWRDPRLIPKTLIADDSEFNRLVLKTLLESLDLLCDEASTGAEALRKIELRARQNSPYEYIFLDIEMLEMSGIEVATELRRQVGEGRLVKAQVVGCSAYVSSEDRQNCLDAGMDYFLEKPVSRDNLVSLMSRIQG